MKSRKLVFVFLLSLSLPGLEAADISVAGLPETSGRRFDFRQVWVNERKTTPASNTSDGSMLRMLLVDKANKTIRIMLRSFPTKEIRFSA